MHKALALSRGLWDELIGKPRTPARPICWLSPAEVTGVATAALRARKRSLSVGEAVLNMGSASPLFLDL